MTDELKPALSAEEWARVEAERVEGIENGWPPLRGVFIDGEDGLFPTGIIYNPFAPVPLIALLNAALPDDSPYKITRDDVAYVLQLATEPFYGGAAYNDKDVWLRLVAKLAALLPPDAPTAPP